MKRKYRYRFPIRINIFKFGITVSWQQPIVKIDDGSISIFLNLFDDQ
jgi:hypothetical protein